MKICKARNCVVPKSHAPSGTLLSGSRLRPGLGKSEKPDVQKLATTNGTGAAQRVLTTVWPLLALNFFMADFQAGIGPFLGVFLLDHGWQSGLVGTVMTIGGVAGMLVVIPAGAMIDATHSKRAWVVAAGIATIAASAIILLSQSFWVVAASQVATAIAGAAIIPAVNAITLGIVGQRGFNRQNGKNQAFNHAGNVVGAALSGYLGWKYGFGAIFLAAGVFGALSIAMILLIPASSIDHAAARGMKSGETDTRASGFSVLFECKPLLVLAAALLAFHLGNGAMLPLYGMAVVSHSHADGPSFVAITIIVAQASMIIASIIAMRMAESDSYWLVLLISFIALPVRGLLASQLVVPWGVYPVQILDGVGAGLQSVAVPGFVARTLDGTGRINVGQGAVMAAQGIGAALSPGIGGWIAQLIGYPAMFMVLGSFALISIGLWIVNRSSLSAEGSSVSEAPLAKA
ncbi:MAG: MFS transporter [Hyphomicrobium sp.]|nr:MAG: MFS transporter [Hyphomicrobium sp.]